MFRYYDFMSLSTCLSSYGTSHLKPSRPKKSHRRAHSWHTKDASLVSFQLTWRWSVLNRLHIKVSRRQDARRPGERRTDYSTNYFFYLIVWVSNWTVALAEPPQNLQLFGTSSPKSIITCGLFRCPKRWVNKQSSSDLCNLCNSFGANADLVWKWTREVEESVFMAL